MKDSETQYVHRDFSTRHKGSFTMSSLFKTAVATLILAVSVGAQAGSNAPTIPSDRMTCGEAIEFYQKYRRIYVVVDGNLLPLYGFTPRQEWRKVVCKGRSKTKAYKFVKTIDKDQCAIGLRCV
jgi:hypothetical protein